jgi:molybdopterin molybdotransferase
MKDKKATEEMVSFDEARRLILNALSPLPSENIQLSRAAGRILAQDATAQVDVPLDDISLRDGYALIAEDTIKASSGNTVRLKVVGESLAGIPSTAQVNKGQAVAINTGAVIPVFADAVVPEEDVEQGDGEIVLKEGVEKGSFIVRKGEEFRAGEFILGPGTFLGLRSIAGLIAGGYTEVRVTRRPRVHVFAVGDELRSPGRDLRTGQGYPGIAYGITAVIEEIGVDGIRVELVPDERRAILEAIPEPEAVDLIITIGGTGTSNRDLVIKDLSEDAGVAFLFRGVRMRPCHSLAFGIMETNIPVICLPGGISAGELGFYQFVLPALMKLLGRREFALPEIKARIEREVLSPKGKRHFIRTRLEKKAEREGSEEQVIARPLRRRKIYQEMIESHGYIVIPEDKEKVKALEDVTVQVTDKEWIGLIF